MLSSAHISSSKIASLHPCIMMMMMNHNSLVIEEMHWFLLAVVASATEPSLIRRRLSGPMSSCPVRFSTYWQASFTVSFKFSVRMTALPRRLCAGNYPSPFLTFSSGCMLETFADDPWPTNSTCQGAQSPRTLSKMTGAQIASHNTLKPSSNESL